MGRKYTLSTADSRFKTELQEHEYSFSELCERLGKPFHGVETVEEYKRCTKAVQDEKKDVGGFVAGKLLGHRRKTGHVQTREIITLDLDNIPAGGAQAILDKLKKWKVSWIVYSTRKHTQATPRLRVLIPLSRPCSADEYEPIARKVGAMLDPTMAMLDRTTFQPHRLMFWPSVCSNGEYICEHAEKADLDTDLMLSREFYQNWKDIQEWPRCPDEGEIVRRELVKLEDPTTKRNVVGAFCRVYDIHAAIETFLDDVYEPCDDGERYTFLGGSTTKGAIVYEDGAYLYSHHGTDPAGGQLLNAFDLVRIHKFGGLDAGEAKTITKMPSYKAMQSLCMQDQAVLHELDEQRRRDTSDLFGVKINPFGDSNDMGLGTVSGGSVCDSLSAAAAGGTAGIVNPFAQYVSQEVRDECLASTPSGSGDSVCLPVESGKPINPFEEDYKKIVNPFEEDYRKVVNAFAEPDSGAVHDNPVQDSVPAAGSNPFGVSGVPDGEAPTNAEEVNPDWKKKLTRNLNTGAIERTINNYVTILMNDPALKGTIKFNEFSHYGVEAQPGLPWNKSKEPRAWTDTDDSYMRMYIEANYGSYSKDMIYDAINIVSEHASYDPVRDFIAAEKWDGVPRLETAIIDYLGAEDTPYTREVTRKSMVAAVARVMSPGTKFDIMTIIGGPQGLGKSTFLRTISNGWFLDGLKSFDDKDTANKMRATWIIEMGELAGLNKMETERVKQFLSQNEDVMRLPYGRRVGVYPRRCIFFGTSNSYDYLKDPTGSRRFWPIDAGVNIPTKDVFNGLIKEVPQLWAEAYHYFKKGENIMVLDEKIAKLAEMVQEEHTELSPKTGIIQEFVARPVPKDWAQMDIEQRKIFWMSPERHSSPDLVPRDRICAAEVWVECLGKDITSMRPTDTREINGILSKIPAFKSSGGSKSIRFGRFYGTQRGFMRNG